MLTLCKLAAKKLCYFFSLFSLHSATWILTELHCSDSKAKWQSCSINLEKIFLWIFKLFAFHFGRVKSSDIFYAQFFWLLIFNWDKPKQTSNFDGANLILSLWVRKKTIQHERVQNQTDPLLPITYSKIRYSFAWRRIFFFFGTRLESIRGHSITTWTGGRRGGQ